MPKATKKKKVSKKPGSTTAPTSACDRGQEIDNLELTIRKTDEMILFFQVCEGVGQIVAHLANVATSDQRKVAEALGVDEQGRLLRINTSSLQPGTYVLTWTFRVDDDNNIWRSTHEMEVNGVTQFRRYKNSDSSRPTNTLFMIIEVVL
jgi:hypothetical protein